MNSVSLGAVMLEPLDVQPTDCQISAELARTQKRSLKDYFFGHHSKEDVEPEMDTTIEMGAYDGVLRPMFRALASPDTTTPIPIHILSFSELLSYPSGSLIGSSISELREKSYSHPETDLHALSALARRLLARFRTFGERNDLFEAISCYDLLESSRRRGSDGIAHLEAMLGLIDSMLCRYIHAYCNRESDARTITVHLHSCIAKADALFDSDPTVWEYLESRMPGGKEESSIVSTIF